MDTIIYEVCTIMVMPAWLLLVFAPYWKWTDRLVHAIWIPGLLCIAYGFAMVLRPASPEGAGFGSLEGVTLLLGTPYGALISWIHFLVFDLFVGAWIARDSLRLRINHLLVVPSLALAFVFGPLGLLLYFATRAVTTKNVRLHEYGKHQDVEQTVPAESA
ncbi:MAG: ABA4-like family protein [Pseudohongiella sp.]|uniref:ABA4-like family protein n=1 Tax=Pseudohongiella sp. TaxID=1979412 RepID=UPI0034A069ED